MKKLLIGILIILLTVMACLAIFKGISIGNLKILSTQEIADENNNLTQEIQEVQKMMLTDYPSKNDELDDNVSRMLTAKKKYLDLVEVSTEGELTKANQEDIYTYEYLWTQLGGYATSEGVTLLLEYYAGDTGETDVKNIHYTVTGPYRAVTDFIADIEDDSTLGFRIENFKMTGADTVQATFATNNVRVKHEQTTVSTTQQ